jgi:hypothetical protein
LELASGEAARQQAVWLKAVGLVEQFKDNAGSIPKRRLACNRLPKAGPIGLVVLLFSEMIRPERK